MPGTKEDGTSEADNERFSINARQALSTSIFWRMWLSQVYHGFLENVLDFKVYIFRLLYLSSWTSLAHMPRALVRSTYLMMLSLL